MLRNITRAVNKDDWTPFGKPVDLLENPRLLYMITLHSPYTQVNTLSLYLLSRFENMDINAVCYHMY